MLGLLKKLLLIGLLSSIAIMPAMAGWGWSEWSYSGGGGGWYHGGGWGWHPHPWHRPYYPGYAANQFATGLLMGGLVGVMAGSAIASAQPPTYVQNNYYPAQSCYQQKAWSRRFCNDHGCFVKTAWRTVCP